MGKFASALGCFLLLNVRERLIWENLGWKRYGAKYSDCVRMYAERVRAAVCIFLYRELARSRGERKKASECLDQGAIEGEAQGREVEREVEGPRCTWPLRVSSLRSLFLAACCTSASFCLLLSHYTSAYAAISQLVLLYVDISLSSACLTIHRHLLRFLTVSPCCPSI